MEVAEVLADRLERHRGVLAAALAAQDHHPAAEFVREGPGEGLDAFLDGPLVDVGLAGGVGDDQAAAGEELQDPTCAGAGPVGGQGSDVGLVDGGVRAEAGQQDAQAAGGETLYLFVPALLLCVVPEVVEQGLGGGGEGGQAVQFPDGYAGPVAPDVEQRGLGRVDQVRRDGRCGRAREGGSLPGLVVRRVIAERPGADREPGREIAAEPQLGPRLVPGTGAVVVDVEAAGPADPVQQRDVPASAAVAVADRVLAPTVAAGTERAESPAVAVPTTAVRLGRDDRTAASARAKNPSLAQNVGSGALAAGQIVEYLLGDQVLAVGVPDGQGQPEHPAGHPPPLFAQPLLGGLGDGDGLQAVVVGEVPVADAPDMLLSEAPTGTEQKKLAAYGRRTHARVVAWPGRCDPLTLQPGPRATRVARPPLQRAVDRL